MAIKYFTGLGKRKHAIARVYIKEGKGNITVNSRTLEDYFNSDAEARNFAASLINL